MAKVVYFTRAPKGKAAPLPTTDDFFNHGGSSSGTSTPLRAPSPPATAASPSSPRRPNGVLGPKALTIDSSASTSASASSTTSQEAASSQPNNSSFVRHRAKRRSSTSHLSTGGRLNFAKFETANLSSCIAFLSHLIESSATSNRVSLDVMKKSVKIMATGGGAHKYFDRLRRELGVEVRREEEMECLVLGLGFVLEVPNEVFWFSDELVQAISHPHATPFEMPSIPRPPTDEEGEGSLPRPSPNPPKYNLLFDSKPAPVQFPFLLVNIGSGVSIIKVDDYDKYERISGTSLGGGTLWGLLSLLTGSQSFDDMLSLADKGDNSAVDMLVGDIYGQDYQKIGLKSSTIASSFGKVFRKEEGKQPAVVDRTTEDIDVPCSDVPTGADERRKFKAEDISRSLLYAISNNIGQIAFMNAEKHNLDRIYFGGGFIRGHATTISTLSYAIRFWSKGTKRALFLRHEGYLGGIGAWLRNLAAEGSETPRALRQVELDMSSLSASVPVA